MQNMNYYYDFSGQKFNHPLSLSINSFDRKVFSRQTSLELSYVLKGSYEVITEHISHSLTEQELAVIAPDEIHILKKLQPESVILTIHIDFERIPENMLGSCKNLFHTILCTPVSNAALLRSLKEEIRRLLMVLFNGDSADGTDLFALNEIMMKILCIAKKQRNTPFEQLPVDSTHHENYVRAIQFIDRHYQEDIHLTDIAKTLSFSTSYTSRLFTRYTGLSFVKYLSYVRVRESLEDLLEGKASIEEISGKCGMPNSKAYSQIFKELYGITPSTYRKRFVKNLLPLPEQETRPMEFTQKQKELLTKVFHLDDTNRLLFHAEGIQIVSDGDTLLCTLSDARQKELLLSQKEDDIVLTIRPSFTGKSIFAKNTTNFALYCVGKERIFLSLHIKINVELYRRKSNYEYISKTLLPDQNRRNYCKKPRIYAADLYKSG